MDNAITEMYAIVGNRPTGIKCDDVESDCTAWEGVVKDTDIVHTDYASVEPIYQGAQTCEATVFTSCPVGIMW